MLDAGCWNLVLFFFFKQKTAYEMRISDWSSDVCSSDLLHRSVRRVLRPGVCEAPACPARQIDPMPRMRGWHASLRVQNAEAAQPQRGEEDERRAATWPKHLSSCRTFR